MKTYNIYPLGFVIINRKSCLGLMVVMLYFIRIINTCFEYAIKLWRIPDGCTHMHVCWDCTVTCIHCSCFTEMLSPVDYSERSNKSLKQLSCCLFCNISEPGCFLGIRVSLSGKYLNGMGCWIATIFPGQQLNGLLLVGCISY